MIMNVDNVKSQMRKGMLEYCILLLLEKQSAYTSDIIQRLKEAELLVVEGTLYPLLTRLKNDHLLTEKGAVFLRELDKAWGEIAATVNYLKQPK